MFASLRLSRTAAITAALVGVLAARGDVVRAGDAAPRTIAAIGSTGAWLVCCNFSIPSARTGSQARVWQPRPPFESATGPESDGFMPSQGRSSTQTTCRPKAVRSSAFTSRRSAVTKGPPRATARATYIAS